MGVEQKEQCGLIFIFNLVNSHKLMFFLVDLTPTATTAWFLLIDLIQFSVIRLPA